MPTDNASVLGLVQAISKIGHDLTSEVSLLSNTSREELVRYAEKLAIAAREPEENLYFQATQVRSLWAKQQGTLALTPILTAPTIQTAQNAAIRTAISMGVFEKIPSSDRGISAADLSARLNVDERLLIRIMRACTSTHLFEEVSPFHYRHNAFSAIMLPPSNRDMFRQMYDFLGQGVYTMPRFLETTEFRNPTDYDNSAFQYGHHTSLGFWEYLKEDPSRAKVFNSGMQSLATVGGTTRSAGPYPFDKELGKEELGETDVLIVDVGGGRGQALEAIKLAFPGLNGRMVLQDVHDVIADAKADGLPSYIEPMAASFFERQPIEGALVYHFRRIFHDWSDDVALSILRNTVHAMTPRSRILIVDTVLPEISAPRYMALQDINMMSFGGMERTPLQWEDLLKIAGLSINRFWVGDGNLQNAIEATL